jgi:MFS transporter, SET family, sugar efflux transporter
MARPESGSSRPRLVLSALAKVPGALPLVALSLLLGLAYSFVVPFLSLFGTREVGMSPLGFGVFMTASSISGIVVSTWLSRWSDTVLSRRSVLLLGGLCGAVGYLGYAFTRNVWVLSIFSLVFLAISSVTFAQLFALARDTLEHGGIEARQIPLYMNIIRLFFALAWTIGPALGAWAVAHSFTLSFVLAAGILALFSLLVAAFVPNTPPSERTRLAAGALPLRLAFKNPALIAHFLAFALYFACSTMGMMNLPLLLLQDLRGSERDIGLAYAIAPIFELPFMVYVGVLATRVRHERLVAASMLLASAYYAALSLSGAAEHVYVLQIASAAIVSVMSGVAISFFQAFLPNQPGSATNLYSTASRLGAMAGYLSFGAVASSFGHRAVFAVSAVATLGASVIVHRFRAGPGPGSAMTIAVDK